jgi:YVTN family beta-propeller protein
VAGFAGIELRMSPGKGTMLVYNQRMTDTVVNRCSLPGDGDIMDVIDTKTLEKSRELESGPDPELMAIDPDGKKIYIANEDDSLVTIMDIKSGDVLGEVPVGVEPEGMGVSPDGKYTVATSESTSMAHVIDNASMKLIANVLVDSRPREAKFTADGKAYSVYIPPEEQQALRQAHHAWRRFNSIAEQIAADNRQRLLQALEAFKQSAKAQRAKQRAKA